MRPGGHGAMGDLRNDPISWTPLDKPLSECTVSLVTTGGAHLRSQPPFDVLKADGDWSFRRIPSETPSADLTFTHTHYNHVDADHDPNCLFPLDRLRDLRDRRVIRDVGRTLFGLMGWVPNATPLIRETAPVIAKTLAEEGVDVVVLSPG